MSHKKKRENYNIYQCATLEEFTEISDRILFTTSNFYNPLPDKSNNEVCIIIDDIDDCRIERCPQCLIWYRMGEFYDKNMNKRAICSKCRNEYV